LPYAPRWELKGTAQREVVLILFLGDTLSLMSIRLNHIGVAIQSLPEMQKLFSLLGLSITGTEPVPDQGVTTHFLPFPSGVASIELLEVTDPEGTVAKFIAKRGPGIHHLSFTVAKGELDALCAKLRENGVRLIYENPKAGAHSMRINFIHPSSAGGMLLELMEPEGRGN
jgi:methylmalonyl-CoA/ethylmalonyl-CoA epimerase